MSSKILINVRPIGTRVAYLENGELRDLKVETLGRNKSLVGSVFIGKVLRVLPGMQAAFIDIGLDRAGFLYVGDVRQDIGGEEVAWADNEEENIFPKAEDTEVKTPIQDLLSEGQKLMIQVAKDPLGTKGARVTTHVSLPGRYIVYMPTVKHIGVSRKIENEEERERLKALVEQFSSGKKGGYIIRTAADGASKDDIKQDIDYLSRVFSNVNRSYEKKKNVGLIRSELDMELRAIRDLANEGVETILIDNKETYKKAAKFVANFIPKLRNKMQYYDKVDPLFDLYEVDLEVSRSLERKIWLKSGGYIIIDEAEALVAIDVNTGSYVGKKDLEDTILKTNLEAVREIAHQLRIRNCGGIIVIDFIDMEREVNREKVINLLYEELEKDKAKTTVMGMSGLGLVEMTRKRIRPSLIKSLCEPCGYCEGKGYLKTKATVAQEIFRELERELPDTGQSSTFVSCHAEVADWIYAEGSTMLEFIEKRLRRSIIFKVEPGYHIEQYEIL